MPTGEYVAELIAEITRLRQTSVELAECAQRRDVEIARLQASLQEFKAVRQDASDLGHEKIVRLEAQLAEANHRIILVTRDNQYWRERFAREVKP